MLRHHCVVLVTTMLLVWTWCLSPQHASSIWAQEKTAAAELRLDVSDPNSPAVFYGNQLITQYLPQSNTKPVFYPLQTVLGQRVVRNYPLTKALPFEKSDHPHHRSFWFSYGEINGVDYWSEEAKQKQGFIVHDNIETKSQAGQVAISSTWNWLNSDKVLQATSSQQFNIKVQDDIVFFESIIRLHASHGDLHIGDTKEGAFAVRVGEYMKVDAKKGGKILNDQLLENDATWGKGARWVQYTGPAENDSQSVANPSDLETGGITMLVHPDCFGYPGRWHVRTYGLFAHNPFGVHDFEASQPATDDAEKARVGGFTVKAGDEVLLRYLILLHDGRLEPQRLESIWEEFANR